MSGLARSLRFFEKSMEEHTQKLGVWISLYCVSAVITGVGAFLFALIGLKNLSETPAGFTLLISLLFLTALIHFFLVYRLLGVKTPATIYMVWAFELANIILTLLGLSAAGAPVLLYLLIRAAFLCYFFLSKRVRALYGFRSSSVESI
ncbi:Uncharacterised protein [Oligella urethralis]|uniref:hypothetical protein n=1 Tax=Oligella urethralis TaxID=90245 RepID=UPI000377BECF|nr:hypothetical protein [Oligella urethralis]SUA58490.1 Uncharacterised protein [Oligella urethralis]SUA60768.1 Uncharacterised protein [Oligella urethralis]SUA66914.1 Uncharacterised protein [Oligella urethralis]